MVTGSEAEALTRAPVTITGAWPETFTWKGSAVITSATSGIRLTGVLARTWRVLMAVRSSARWPSAMPCAILRTNSPKSTSWSSLTTCVMGIALPLYGA